MYLTHHCSDCGQDVTVIDTVPGGSRCAHCNSLRVTPMIAKAPPVADVPVIEEVPVIEPPVIEETPHKTKKVKARK